MGELTTNLKVPARDVATVRGLFESSQVQDQITKALPSFLTVDRLTRIMLTQFRTNPKLLTCSQQSLLACFFGCASLGLTPEPWLGQAYLVPFWNSKLNCNEATLIPGYRGLVTLARRSGFLQTVKAAAVYENEPFNWDRINPERSTHGWVKSDPGELIGAWTLWTFNDSQITGDFMTAWEIDKIMEKSKSRNRKGELVGPWVTDKAEMAKKTVIRRHFKLAPVSVEDQALAQAVEAENVALAGPGGQARMFLPELTAPEIDYMASDFDKEFKDISGSDQFEGFLSLAVNSQTDIRQAEDKSAPAVTVDEFKMDVMASGADDFRENYQHFCAAASAKNVTAKKQPPEKAAASKKATYGQKAAAKKETAKQAPQDEMDALLASDIWQEMSMLKDTEAKIFQEESGGQIPRTIPTCMDLVDRITARVGASDDIPG